MDGNGTERFETVVIGGGQAGLSAGYHLKEAGRPFVIVDANERVGDAWRKRYDSLHLFTPARYDGLPGGRFPGRSVAGADEGSRWPTTSSPMPRGSTSRRGPGSA